MNPPPPPFSGDCEIFSPCWCAVAGRQNNPHCKPSVSINSSVFIIAMIIFGSLLISYKLKIINMKTLFERFYDSVTNFLSKGKSFAPNELKSFR